MNKQKLLEELIANVTTDLEKAKLSAIAASAGATHEENKAEGNKDMRSTEASYLARGQVMRVEELEETLNRLRFLPVGPFHDDDPISAGALVCLENDAGDQRWYYLVTAGAGYSLHADALTITTITTQSPLGKELVERFTGDDIELFAGGRHEQLEIIEVQ